MWVHHEPVGRPFALGFAAVAVVIVAAVLALSGGEAPGGESPAQPSVAAATTPTVAPAAAPVVSRPRAAKHRPRAAKHRWPRHIATDYAMFSRAGDRAVRAVVIRAAAMLKAGASRGAVMRMVHTRFEALLDRYDEAGDTAVREALADELDRWLKAAGYDTIESYDEFDY
jgi:hypothetical protein